MHEPKIAISGVQKTKKTAFTPLTWSDFDGILTVVPDHIRMPKLDLQVQKGRINLSNISNSTFTWGQCQILQGQGQQWIENTCEL